MLLLIVCVSGMVLLSEGLSFIIVSVKDKKTMKKIRETKNGIFYNIGR